MGNAGHAPALPIPCGFASVSHTVACARTNKSEYLSENGVFRQFELNDFIHSAFIFRYLPGEIPVIFLKTRLKYCREEKPLFRAQDSNDKKEWFISLFALLIRIEFMYLDGEILY